MTKSFKILSPGVMMAVLLGLIVTPGMAQASAGGAGLGYSTGYSTVIPFPEGYYTHPRAFVYPPYFHASPVPSPPGFTCYAGAYVCPLQVMNPTNGPCTCPTDNGYRANGTVQ